MIGFPTCPECGGSGFDVEHGVIDQATGEDFGSVIRPCPSCVEGVVITDELRNDVAAALWRFKYPETLNEWSHMPLDVRVKYRAMAHAVLVAAVRHLKAEVRDDPA